MKRIEEESMTPEQRSQRDRDLELKKYKDAEAARQKAEEDQKAEQLANHYRAEYEKGDNQWT